MDIKTELPPGPLCRAALYDDPVTMAAAIVAWNPEPIKTVADVAAWLRAVADALDA